MPDILKFLNNYFKRQPELSHHQLQALLTRAMQHQVLSKEEGSMMRRILNLADTPISSIMIPKSQLVCLEASATMGQIVDAFLKWGFSRLPVYDTDQDNIIGIIHVKELLRFWHRSAKNIRAVEFIRLPNFFPQTMKVAQALSEFQKRNISIAITIDEYGIPSGMITTEDLVEQIVGELYDEYNVELRYYRLMENGNYLIDACIPLDKFQEMFKLNLESQAHTLSGYILEKLQRIPLPGEKFRIHNLECAVEEGTPSKLKKLVIHDKRA
ncbi:MAG: hemolysin family protein [Candidatus Edwardsbacteria bacterium]|nr:hemolysin family protein [Candidatus Edwardsbacteria bacterium]MBU1577675.1 hemolysin family protein [Candidatus Edwardsbacteria bacterium]MBU2594572.1 hemolysin family protein [Candidatus Edwardsbacteria bacterium]